MNEPVLLPPAPLCHHCGLRPGFGLYEVEAANEVVGHLMLLCAECSLSGHWARIGLFWSRPATTAVPPDLVDHPKGPALSPTEAFEASIQRKMAQRRAAREEAAHHKRWTVPLPVVMAPTQEVPMKAGPMLRPHVREKLAQDGAKAAKTLARLGAIARQAFALQQETRQGHVIAAATQRGNGRWTTKTTE